MTKNLRQFTIHREPEAAMQVKGRAENRVFKIRLKEFADKRLENNADPNGLRPTLRNSRPTRIGEPDWIGSMRPQQSAEEYRGLTICGTFLSVASMRPQQNAEEYSARITRCFARRFPVVCERCVFKGMGYTLPPSTRWFNFSKCLIVKELSPCERCPGMGA